MRPEPDISGPYPRPDPPPFDHVYVHVGVYDYDRAGIVNSGELIAREGWGDVSSQPRHSSNGAISPMDWHLHPEVLVFTLLLEGFYLLYVGPRRDRLVWPDLIKPKASQFIMFSLGVSVIYLAEGTPLHELSEQYLFSAHMVQHLLLTLVVPPLLLMGTPGWLLRPAMDHPVVARVMRILTSPVVALGLFNATLALWHVPDWYDATLRVHPIHIVEHISFLSTAILMWWPILSPLPEFPRLPYPGQMLYIFIQSFLPSVIAALITFSDRLVYPFYGSVPRLWNVSPLADQQMGGLIMKLSGVLVLLVAFSIIFFLWFAREESQVSKT